ncbi:hypothetical protein CSPX01_06842 [Colletotrichum filicis]|nr:hypothetical protein CSPX01_06842 [Colletotrichum filicis]
MRLLKRHGEGEYELSNDMTEDELPAYAILSHTWLLNNDMEVTYRDMDQGDPRTAKPEGFAKLLFCGEQAARDGLHYFWIDTCCINKESSAELQEALTSMFSWYRRATRCYAYLSDVSLSRVAYGGTESPPPLNLWDLAFRDSRWFKRGWTLQELLAPTSVEFFSEERTKLGDRDSLQKIIHEVTDIPLGALNGDDLDAFSVEERFSWARHRRTKRQEDGAYCLLGIFNVFMPLMYGERESAFTRLREEINKKQTSLPEHLLERIPGVMGAAFNSRENQDAPTCLPNTRTELLQIVKAWIEGTEQSHIFWLNGIAGCGKSTVARTIARIYHDRKMLGGSFFFSKINGNLDLTKASKLVATLACQVASRIPESKQYILQAIAEQEDIMECALRDQWKQLIIQPLSKLRSRSSPRVVLLVIDALDECDKWRDVRAIIKMLPDAKAITNTRLRIFITSRPEPSIRHEWQRLLPSQRQLFVLNDIPQALVNRDIGSYFEHEFSILREKFGFGRDWPGSRIIKRLIQAASELFIWAATACRFISKRRLPSAVNQQIDRLIHGEDSRGSPENQLNGIYKKVLEFSVFSRVELSDEPEDGESHLLLRKVLSSMVILCSPLPVGPLARLIGSELPDVQYLLTDLNTIFQVPDDDSRPVHLHHPTFRDFLINKNRCTDMRFWVDEKLAHKDMGDYCVDLMMKNLHMNICDLRHPSYSVTSLEVGQVKRRIPPDLEYACLYWVEHYRQSGTSLRDGDKVDLFFREHFLHWLEAINLMGKSTEQGAIIRMYHSLLHPRKNERQIPFVKDARRLIFNYQNIIKQAPLQVYCSALAFIPSTNELKWHFRSQRHPCIENIRIAEANVTKAKDDFNYVSDLSFTLDGRYLASGSNFEAVRLWNVSTRATVRKYEGGATDKMSAIAISPDGNTLAGGSDDFTVMVWDTQSGSLRYSIKDAHKGWVNAVDFSPDGRRLVSGSMDESVAIWHANTGDLIQRFDNHSSSINSAIFSPCGTIVATGSGDELVRLWNVSKTPPEVSSILEGHTRPVNCVRFSQNGRVVASGSDDMTIKIWEVSNGSVRFTLEGHTKKLWAIAFSSDDRILASGSEDKTVRLWDATRGSPLAVLKDHTSGINSVVFSPDDTLLATGSFDDEVRLWNTDDWTLVGKLDDFAEDANSGILATQRPYILKLDDVDKGHAKEVSRVVFSPNGEVLASGSQDSTIKLWHGSEVYSSLEGHSGGISHLSFSPNGKQIVSGSSDLTLRVWNVELPSAPHILEGHYVSMGSNFLQTVASQSLGPMIVV